MHEGGHTGRPTFHNIRGSAGTCLADAGCEVPEIATITGDFLDAHYLGRTTKLAVSAVGKLERAAAATGTDGEQKLENNQTVPDAARDK
jgi:hypothetical protein